MQDVPLTIPPDSEDMKLPLLPLEMSCDAESPLLLGAKYLVAHFQKGMGKYVCRPGDPACSVMMKRVHGAAQATLEAQDNAMGEFCGVLADGMKFGEWEPVGLVEHALYDETELPVRVQMEGRDADLQRAKIFVLERSWSMLVKVLPLSKTRDGDGCGAEYVIVDIALSSRVRATLATTGETVYELLSKATPLPDVSSFPFLTRLVETDEHGGNQRGETFFTKLAETHGSDASVLSMS